MEVSGGLCVMWAFLPVVYGRAEFGMRVEWRCYSSQLF